MMHPDSASQGAPSEAGHSDAASDTRPLLPKGPGNRGEGAPLLPAVSHFSQAGSVASGVGHGGAGGSALVAPASGHAALPPGSAGGLSQHLREDWAALSASAHHWAAAASHGGSAA